MSRFVAIEFNHNYAGFGLTMKNSIADHCHLAQEGYKPLADHVLSVIRKSQ
jgi:lysophospholipase L1-like esterase